MARDRLRQAQVTIGREGSTYSLRLLESGSARGRSGRCARQAQGTISSATGAQYRAGSMTRCARIISTSPSHGYHSPRAAGARKSPRAQGHGRDGARGLLASQTSPRAERGHLDQPSLRLFQDQPRGSRAPAVACRPSLDAVTDYARKTALSRSWRMCERRAG
jgi:hypothetical protein